MSRAPQRRVVGGSACAGLLLACVAAGPGSGDAEPVTYFIAEGDPATGFVPSDRELAVWALQEWAEQAELELTPGPEETATIRVFWVRADDGLYGEMRSRRIGERMGADVFVRPDVRGLGPDVEPAAASDPLYRETIVYLTCVHELGHAFGLGHTSAFDDIMYSFQFGGDLRAYFGRFRDRLDSRADIPTTSPLSAADVDAMRRQWSR